MFRILISAPVVGAIGGAERYVLGICRVFPDAEIDVVWSVMATEFMPSSLQRANSFFAEIAPSKSEY